MFGDVLIVDDEKDIRDLVAGILEDAINRDWPKTVTAPYALSAVAVQVWWCWISGYKAVAWTVWRCSIYCVSAIRICR